MTRRVIIGRRDWMQQPGVTLSGGFWRLPLTNMLDARPQIVAEAENNKDWACTRFDVDLGVQRKVGLFWFVNLRATSLGLLQLIASLNSDLSSPTYDTGVTTPWPQDSTAGENNAWGQWTLNGVYPTDDYAALGFPRFFLPDDPIDARYIRVIVRDSAADEPLQIGCFGASEIWEAPIELTPNWQWGAADESNISRVPMGSTYVDQAGTRRRLNLGFPMLPEDDVWSRSYSFPLVKGRSEPLVILPFAQPSDVTRLEKVAVYGRLSQDTPLSNPFVGRYAQTFQIDQDI